MRASSAMANPRLRIPPPRHSERVREPTRKHLKEECPNPSQRPAAHRESVVVNYASSLERAEKVLVEITNAGGKAVAIGAQCGRQR
jgi:hypothetical protein